MEILVFLYYLGNGDKRIVRTCSVWFFPNIFNPVLVESEDMVWLCVKYKKMGSKIMHNISIKRAV
jgi:hypothetical protein